MRCLRNLIRFTIANKINFSPLEVFVSKPICICIEHQERKLRPDLAILVSMIDRRAHNWYRESSNSTVFGTQKKTVLIEIHTIRGLCMIRKNETGIYEIKSPPFFIKRTTEEGVFCMPIWFQSEFFLLLMQEWIKIHHYWREKLEIFKKILKKKI